MLWLWRFLKTTKRWKQKKEKRSISYNLTKRKIRFTLTMRKIVCRVKFIAHTPKMVISHIFHSPQQFVVVAGVFIIYLFNIFCRRMDLNLHNVKIDSFGWCVCHNGPSDLWTQTWEYSTITISKLSQNTLVPSTPTRPGRQKFICNVTKNAHTHTQLINKKHGPSSGICHFNDRFHLLFIKFSH